MRIVKPGRAGTLESCDASVSVEPAEELVIVVEPAERRFERLVRETAAAALGELGVTAAKVTVRDRNALDCTVRARVLAACLRAAGRDEAPWEGLA